MKLKKNTHYKMFTFQFVTTKPKIANKNRLKTVVDVCVSEERDRKREKVYADKIVCALCIDVS